MEQELEGLPWKLHELWLRSRVHQIQGVPEMPTNQGQTVREGWLGFVIPCRYRHRDLLVLAQLQGQHGHQREQCQQDGNGAGDGLVRPLALGFQPEVRAGLFKGHLHRPAHHDPLQDLHGHGLQVGTEKRLHPQLPLRVAHDDKANRHRGQAGSVPQGCAREDPELFELAPVPLRLHGLPWGIGALRPALQAPLPRALGGFKAALAWGLWLWPMLERGIPSQARDHDHPAFDTCQGQGDRCKATIEDQHQPAPRQPAAHLLHHLPHPIYTGFVPSSLGLLRGPTQRGEKGQCPHPSTPGHRHQEHHRDPFQPETADDMLVRGTDCIPVTFLRFDLPSRAPFHRVVSPEDDCCPCRHQQRDQQAQQHPAPVLGRPGGPVQNPMIVREAALRRQAHHPQGGGDCAGPGSEHRAQQQDLGMGARPGAKRVAQKAPRPV
jgi:hypothetical protein